MPQCFCKCQYTLALLFPFSLLQYHESINAALEYISIFLLNNLELLQKGPLTNHDLIFDRHANLKYKYGNRHFWCRGYYVDTVGKNTEKIAEYIRNQLQEDIMNDQISIKEYIDPFTGSKNTKA